jgi:hypothetical protein
MPLGTFGFSQPYPRTFQPSPCTFPIRAQGSPTAQGSSSPARGCRSRATSEMGRHASSPVGDWVQWWRRGEHRRAPTAGPRLRGRRSPDSGEVRRDAGQLRAMEEPKGPRGCFWGAGCDGDGRRSERSGNLARRRPWHSGGGVPAQESTAVPFIGARDEMLRC